MYRKGSGSPAGCTADGRTNFSAGSHIHFKKLEDLVLELKKNYTIIIVTHNMQQAARISDKTAFLLLGELIEYDSTEKLFFMPEDKRTGRLYHREVRIMRKNLMNSLPCLTKSL